MTFTNAIFNALPGHQAKVWRCSLWSWTKSMSALAACFVLTAAAPVAVRSDLETPPTLHLARGISLAGWFNWVTVDATGAYDRGPFRKTGQLSTAELRRLRVIGFDFVRLPVDPGVFLSAKGEARAQRFAEVAAAIDAIHAAGLSVIWDYHPRALRYTYSYADIFTEQGRLVSDFRDLLRETAHFLARYPADHTALEIINEPPEGCNQSQGGRYNDLVEAAYSAARSGNAKLPLILEGGCFASSDALTAFDLTPYRRDKAVLFTFHFYEPAIFAQQGDPDKASLYYRNLGALPYPARGDGKSSIAALRSNLASAQPRAAEKILKMKEQQDALDAGANAVARYLRSGVDAAWIRRRFDTVGRWAMGQRIAPARILLGEFSVMRARRGRGATDTDRERWLSDVRAAAERRGFPWCYWAYFDPQNRMSLVIAPDRRIDPVVVSSLRLSMPIGQEALQ